MEKYNNDEEFKNQHNAYMRAYMKEKYHSNQDFRDKQKAYMKEKYHSDPDFKTKHNAYMTEKITCPDCNSVISRSNKTHHLQSKKHLLSLKKN